MYRTSKTLETKLRLNEINRRFAELRAISSKLADMAAQLDRLRKVNGRVRVLINRRVSSNRRGDVISSKCLGNGQCRIRLSRDLIER